MCGPFITLDSTDKVNWGFDEGVMLTRLVPHDFLHSWPIFLEPLTQLVRTYVPDNLLCNDSFTWHKKTDTTNLLRVITHGAFVSQ